MSTPPVIFVIGYGPGIGAGVADLFASKGFSVGIAARSANRLAEAKSKLSSQNVKASTAQIDVVSPDSIYAGLSKLEKELGAPSVVVFNVGSNGAPGTTLGPKPIGELTPELYELHFRVTALAPLIVSRWSVEHMKEYNGKKTILYTGGGLSLLPRPGLAALASTKAALRNLSQSYHNDYKKEGFHFALITVKGRVAPEDPKHSPKLIAEEYWKIVEEQSEWTWEIQY